MSNHTITAACRRTSRFTNRLKLSGLAFSTIVLAACGGGSESASNSTSSTASEPGLGAALSESIEGRWQSECYLVGDQVSVSDQIEFDGVNYEQLSLFYADSETCNGQLNLVLTIDGNYVTTGGTTQTSTVTAQHINLSATDIDIISTPALEAFLALSGTTVDEFANQQLGIANLQNPQPQDLGISSPFFSLFAIEDGQLRMGDTSSNSGSSAETRLTELTEDGSGTFNRF